MGFFRTHTLIHVLFLALIAIIAAVGIVRTNRFMTQRAIMVQHVRTDATVERHIAQLHVLLRQCRTAFDSSGTDDSLSEYEALVMSVATLRTALNESREHLGSDLYFQQLQTRSHHLESALRQSSNHVPQFASTLDSLFSLWNGLNDNAIRRRMQREHDILKQHDRVLYEAAMGFTVLVLISVIYLYAVRHYLAAPVRNLTQTARAVTSGDLGARAAVGDAGPVSALASDFNNMIDMLVEGLYEEERVVQALQDKNEQLKEANRHKSHFLATVSHELKTPLNAIIGFADILATEHHGSLTSRQSQYVQRIFTAGEHLLDMISDLIDVAKIDVGALTLNPSVFVCGDVLTEVIAMTTPHASEKNHTIHPPLNCTQSVCLDPTRFKQIVLNLVTNAIKFTPQNGNITVECQCTDSQLVVRVRDDGIGIASTDQKRIFDDFVQLDSQLHRHHEGTGIGLPLCARLAQLMNGDVTVTSEPGRGSTFTLSLPLYSPSHRPSSREGNTPSSRRAATASTTSDNTA